MILVQYPPGFLPHTKPYLDVVSVVFEQSFKNHCFLLEAMRGLDLPIYNPERADRP
jgi:hypothetical protein